MFTLNVTSPNGETYAISLTDDNDVDALCAAGFEVCEVVEVIEVDAWVMGILTGMKMQ
ncbi:MAG: hypothetical protein KBG81_05300 [Moraxellaceae bacterium]|nr:hypothetical protein [Moraxellaceae bacterium]